MKKNFLLMASIALLGLGLSACEPEELNLTGRVELAVSATTGTQACATGDTLVFKSALANVKTDSVVVDETTYELNVGTLIIGSTNDIVTGSFETLGFPLMGLNLRGETAQNYTISLPINDVALFQQLSESAANALITGGLQVGDEVGNLFVIAMSEDAYYIGYEGSVNITKFGDNGSTIVGTANNVKAIYLTGEMLNELMEKTEEEIAAIDVASYFPTATFNGTIDSRRLPLDAVIAALEQ